MPDVLTDATQVKCPHGGTATVSSGNTKVKDENGYVLVASDVHTVAGCAFMRGQQPSPCVQVKWQAAALKVGIDNQKALTLQSVGLCYAADNSPQGPAIKVGPKKSKAT